jgi:hypothetical protein
VVRDAEAEEQMILERLLAIQDLRREARRLESERRDASGSDVAIPAGWLHLLARGLAIAIEDVESDHAEGTLSDREYLEHVERTQWLAQAIRDTAPDSAYSVRPDYHEELHAGLSGAFCIQKFEAEGLFEHHDPHGLHFIAQAQLVALYEFITILDDLMDEGR